MEISITMRSCWYPLLIGLSLGLSAQVIAADKSALETQHANALPLTSFYDVKGADLSKPGTLIRTEEGTGYTLPGGVTAKRIAYASRDVSGKAVLATGVVLLPPGTPPPGGWPVIAWAHGTAGVARVCAPSLMKDLHYGWEGLFIYPLMGYAVIATDYAGLGSPGPHQLIWSKAQANDVVFSVPAARAAVPALGPKWVAVGHSQGGAATLKVSVLEHSLHDPGYLGAVSLAPPTDIAAMWQRLDKQKAPGGLGLIALGIKAGEPAFDVAEIVGPGMLDALRQMQQEACFDAAFEAVAKLSQANLQKPHWSESPGVVRFEKANRPYLEPGRGPLLILLGDHDPAIPRDITTRAVRQLCAIDERVDFRVYPGMNHDEVVDASIRDQLAWIADRFAGRPAQRGCPASPQSGTKQ